MADKGFGPIIVAIQILFFFQKLLVSALVKSIFLNIAAFFLSSRYF